MLSSYLSNVVNTHASSLGDLDDMILLVEVEKTFHPSRISK